jgi:DNA-binding GntR family transcriptional regulator
MKIYAPLNNLINASAQQELLGKSPSVQVNYICDNLKNFMVKGLLPVNSKLNIQVLKKKYSVSTGVIQAAVANLINNRYAYKVSNGVFVAGLSLDELHEILNLRLILEKRAVNITFLAGGDEWESEIISACHRLSKLEKNMTSGCEEWDIGPLKEWSNSYKNFHLLFFSSSKLNLSAGLIKNLYEQCDKYFLSSLLRHELSLKDISGHHEMLRNAVIARNVKDAELILTDHVQKIYQVHKKNIDAINLN